MPKRSLKAAATNERSKYQTGSVVRVKRSEINLAPYNPRQIKKGNFKRLRENLRKVGLVGPALVLNRRTGNLVGGHKRLAGLDVLEGYDGTTATDYQLDVTVVDWDLEKEKRQNTFFNNTNAQGEFDLDLLGDLLVEDLGNIEGFGFDLTTIAKLFPDDERFTPLFPEDEIEKKETRKTEVAAHERRLSERPSTSADEGSPDFCVVVVCRDDAHCQEVLTAMGVEDAKNRQVPGDRVLAALGAYQE